VNGNVNVIAVSSAGDVYVGGDFTTAGGASANHIAKWNGSAWSALGSGMNDYVYALAVDNATGDVYAGGTFTTAGGVTANRIARWNGSAWSALGSGTNNAVLALAVNGTTGDLYAGGNFTTAGGGSANHIAKWDGSSWSTLGSGTNDLIYALELNNADNLYAGGNFTTAGGKVSKYIGLWHAPLPPTPTPVPTQTPGGPTATPASSPTACPIQFTDVPPGSTFYDNIRCLACRGIINGYSDGTFKPNNQVTRGQLSKIVSNSAGFNDNQTTQMFQDVPIGSTFFQYIGRLSSRGYISGYTCGGPGEPCIPPANLPYFRPNSNATREQISKIVSNAAGFNDPPSGQQFQDVPGGSTYYEYIYRLATRNVMQGYTCGGPGEPCVPPANLPYFRPNNNATRGQTSKIVGNTFFPDCQTP
jgi:hypothetical protein